MKTTYPLVVIALLLVGGCTSSPPPVKIEPKATFQARPRYPLEMRNAKISGEVLVDFTVNAEGIPVRFFVIRSSRKEFEAPALEAVRRWRFQPGTLDGKPVPTHMVVPIIFTLDETKV